MIRAARILGNTGRDWAATPTLVAHMGERSIAAQLGDDAGIAGIAEAWQLPDNGTFS